MARKVIEAKELAESLKRTMDGAKKTVEPCKKPLDNGKKMDEKKTHKVKAHEPTVFMSVEPTSCLCCRELRLLELYCYYSYCLVSRN